MPVTLLFIRDHDDRAFRLREWIDPQIIHKEECLTFVLRNWGMMPNCRVLRFVFMVEGHVAPMVTNEVIRQYVAQAQNQVRLEAKK